MWRIFLAVTSFTGLILGIIYIFFWPKGKNYRSALQASCDLFLQRVKDCKDLVSLAEIEKEVDQVFFESLKDPENRQLTEWFKSMDRLINIKRYQLKNNETDKS